MLPLWVSLYSPEKKYVKGIENFTSEQYDSNHRLISRTHYNSDQQRTYELWYSNVKNKSNTNKIINSNSDVICYRETRHGNAILTCQHWSRNGDLLYSYSIHEQREQYYKDGILVNEYEVYTPYSR